MSIKCDHFLVAKQQKHKQTAKKLDVKSRRRVEECSWIVGCQKSNEKSCKELLKSWRKKSKETLRKKKKKQECRISVFKKAKFIFYFCTKQNSQR